MKPSDYPSFRCDCENCVYFWNEFSEESKEEFRKAWSKQQSIEVPIQNGSYSIKIEPGSHCGCGEPLVGNYWKGRCGDCLSGKSRSKPSIDARYVEEVAKRMKTAIEKNMDGITVDKIRSSQPNRSEGNTEVLLVKGL